MPICLFIWLVKMQASLQSHVPTQNGKPYQKGPILCFEMKCKIHLNFFLWCPYILYVWPYIVLINCFRLFTKKVYKNNVIMIWVCLRLGFRFNELVDDRRGGVERAQVRKKTHKDKSRDQDGDHEVTNTG